MATAASDVIGALCGVAAGTGFVPLLDTVCTACAVATEANGAVVTDVTSRDAWVAAAAVCFWAGFGTKGEAAVFEADNPAREILDICAGGDARLNGRTGDAIEAFGSTPTVTLVSA